MAMMCNCIGGPNCCMLRGERKSTYIPFDNPLDGNRPIYPPAWSWPEYPQSDRGPAIPPSNAADDDMRC